MKYILVVITLAISLFGSLVFAEVLIDGPEVDLTSADMADALRSLPAEQLQAIKSDKRLLRQAMDTTYMTKVAAERARGKQLDKRADVRAIINNRANNILALAEIEDVVANSGSGDFTVAAKEFYLANPEKFTRPEQVEASHILINFDGRSEPESLQEAQRLLEMIKSDSSSFEELAKKHSDDPGSGQKGGSLGRFGRGQMVKPFEQAVFALTKVGSLTPPVKSQFGYHIIRLDGRYPAELLAFEKVQDKIIEDLKKKHRKRVHEEYLIEIRDDKRVKLNTSAIEQFLDQPEALLQPAGN